MSNDVISSEVISNEFTWCGVKSKHCNSFQISTTRFKWSQMIPIGFTWFQDICNICTQFIKIVSFSDKCRACEQYVLRAFRECDFATKCHYFLRFDLYLGRIPSYLRFGLYLGRIPSYRGLVQFDKLQYQNPPWHPLANIWRSRKCVWYPHD